MLVRISYKSTLFKILIQLAKLLRVYPYFIFHYTFGLLTLKDEIFKNKFQEVKHYSSDVPYRIQHDGMLSQINDNIKKEIDSKKSPLYKLTYRYDIKDYNENCVLYYLLEKAFKSEK